MLSLSRAVSKCTINLKNTSSIDLPFSFWFTGASAEYLLVEAIDIERVYPIDKFLYEDKVPCVDIAVEVDE